MLEATRLNQLMRSELRRHDRQNDRLQELLSQRQQLPPRSAAQRKDLNKAMSREIKTITQLERRATIHSILEQFSGL